MELDPICPLCANHPETINHLFLECDRTKDVWSLCSLDRVRSDSDNLSFEAILLSQDNTTLTRIASLLWALWRARNNVIWRGSNWNALSISIQVANALEDWNSGRFNTTDRRSIEDIPRCWNPPENEWLKCNVDAALFKDENKVGFGLILRDNQANFVATKGGLLHCIFDPGIAEAYACREALLWIQSKGLSKVVIESDCAEVVKAIQGKTKRHNYVGRIVADCQHLQSSLHDISFSCIKREANTCAHKLARLTRTDVGIGDWSSQPPDCIALSLDQ